MGGPLFSFLSFPFLFITFFSLLVFPHVVYAANVTLDDNDASIRYSDGWSVSNAVNELNYGGFHHLTNSRTASASFTFTGIAIYFMSPKWPYNVAAQIAVDSQTSTLVDLRDYSRDFDEDGGPETIDSEVVWGVSGLENTQHTLFVSFPADRDWLVLDALIYTEEDEDSNGSSSSSSSSTSTGSSSASSETSSSSAGGGGGGSSVNALAIGLGVGLSVAGLILILSAFILFRRRKHYQDQAAAASNVAPFSNVPKRTPPSMMSHYSVEPFAPPGHPGHMGHDGQSTMSSPYTSDVGGPGATYDPYGGATLAYSSSQRRQTMSDASSAGFAGLGAASPWPNEKARYMPQQQQQQQPSSMLPYAAGSSSAGSQPYLNAGSASSQHGLSSASGTGGPTEKSKMYYQGQGNEKEDRPPEYDGRRI